MANRPDDLLDLLGEMLWWLTTFFRRLSGVEERGSDELCRFQARLESLGVVARAPGSLAERIHSRVPREPPPGRPLRLESLKRRLDGSVEIVIAGVPAHACGGRQRALRLEPRLASLFLALLGESGVEVPGGPAFRTKQDLVRLMTDRQGPKLLASKNARPEDLVVKYVSRLRRELVTKVRADVIQSVPGRGYRMLFYRPESGGSGDR
jgi:hypothetical protein